MPSLLHWSGFGCTFKLPFCVCVCIVFVFIIVFCACLLLYCRYATVAVVWDWLHLQTSPKVALATFVTVHCHLPCYAFCPCVLRWAISTKTPHCRDAKPLQNLLPPNVHWICKPLQSSCHRILLWQWLIFLQSGLSLTICHVSWYLSLVAYTNWKLQPGLAFAPVCIMLAPKCIFLLCVGYRCQPM